MYNLTTSQKIAIAVAILSVLSTSSALLTDIAGASVAKIIVAVSSLCASVMSSVLAVLTGQGSQIQAVRSMPGVETITVNKDANETLARLAVSSAEPKIKVLASDRAAVIETAKGEAT
jgi:mannose/fructose-specific phosphotransferase system component IIA